jgi:hypothetical protein
MLLWLSIFLLLIVWITYRCRIDIEDSYNNNGKRNKFSDIVFYTGGRGFFIYKILSLEKVFPKEYRRRKQLQIIALYFFQIFSLMLFFILVIFYNRIDVLVKNL